MIYTHDQKANAGYIKFSEKPIKKTIRVSDSILCDVDQNGLLCGIEVIGVQKKELIQWSKTL